MKDAKLELIKILMKYIIVKKREEEAFMEYLNENKSLFHIDVSPIIDVPFYEIVEKLEIDDEKKLDEIYECIVKKDKNIDEIVNEFCKTLKSKL